mmetsp:Transcript_22/g.76  ORF Transcript_22/g.76 Transcript_22/m.76 type:complete len:470 (-) Transcript_22:899-2308(-)
MRSEDHDQLKGHKKSGYPHEVLGIRLRFADEAGSVVEAVGSHPRDQEERGQHRAEDASFHDDMAEDGGELASEELPKRELHPHDQVRHEVHGDNDTQSMRHWRHNPEVPHHNADCRNANVEQGHSYPTKHADGNVGLVIFGHEVHLPTLVDNFELGRGHEGGDDHEEDVDEKGKGGDVGPHLDAVWQLLTLPVQCNLHAEEEHAHHRGEVHGHTSKSHDLKPEGRGWSTPSKFDRSLVPQHVKHPVHTEVGNGQDHCADGSVCDGRAADLVKHSFRLLHRQETKEHYGDGHVHPGREDVAEEAPRPSRLLLGAEAADRLADKEGCAEGDGHLQVERRQGTTSAAALLLLHRHFKEHSQAVGQSPCALDEREEDSTEHGGEVGARDSRGGKVFLELRRRSVAAFADNAQCRQDGRHREVCQRDRDDGLHDGLHPGGSLQDTSLDGSVVSALTDFSVADPRISEGLVAALH